jgi:hypothetical protein
VLRRDGSGAHRLASGLYASVCAEVSEQKSVTCPAYAGVDVRPNWKEQPSHPSLIGKVWRKAIGNGEGRTPVMLDTIALIAVVLGAILLAALFIVQHWWR